MEQGRGNRTCFSGLRFITSVLLSHNNESLTFPPRSLFSVRDWLCIYVNERTWITALSLWRGSHNSMKLWAMLCTRRMGHSGEFWQNVVPLEEWMANGSSILVTRTPWTEWKGKKDMTLKDEPPRSVGVQYATGEEQRTITNSSRKNEATRPKRKPRSVVDVSGGESKVQC